MKKKLIILLASIFVFTANNFVFATSGACSYHNGVNCTASSGLFGQVICNDGSSDSSIQYTDVHECKDTEDLPRCPSIFSQGDLDNAKSAYIKADTNLNNLISQYKTNTEQVLRGTYPLTEYQQKIITDFRAKTDAVIKQTIEVNQKYENSVHVANSRMGFTDEKVLQKIITENNQKITYLKEQQEADIAKNTLDFLDANYKIIKQNYTSIYPSTLHLWKYYLAMSHCPITTGTSRIAPPTNMVQKLKTAPDQDAKNFKEIDNSIPQNTDQSKTTPLIIKTFVDTPSHSFWKQTLSFFQKLKFW